MTFRQVGPELPHPYHSDELLRGYLEWALPGDMAQEMAPSLAAMGEVSGGELFELQQADRTAEPRFTQWDAWGNRVDEIEHTKLWRRAEQIAIEFGLTAIPYEKTHGRWSRTHQFALVYLFTPSSDIYSCPLAMTDAAARTLILSGNDRLAPGAVARLTARDPERFWTSGQWMTESTGGSDVGRTETVARQGEDGQWRLYGQKWFTSAAASQMALTLARPEGPEGETQGEGGRNLALFYIETRDDSGRLQGIRIDRLKEKLGTKKLPTAELTLDGTPAELVAGTTDGIRNIAPMLNITRVWNAVTAVSFMRRGLSLAEDYGAKRIAFGAPLAAKPAFRDLLATLDAEFFGAFLQTFRTVELLGADECGEASEEETALLRLLTPIVKLTTAKQAVAVASEVLEAFGGAGYVEDTGLPTLLRDAQVLPIWEGTTDVLALDTLRVLQRGSGLEALRQELEGSEAAERALDSAVGWLESAQKRGQAEVEAGARRFALTLGRAHQLALVARSIGAAETVSRTLGERAQAADKRLAPRVDQILTFSD